MACLLTSETAIPPMPQIPSYSVPSLNDLLGAVDIPDMPQMPTYGELCI